MNKNYLNFAEGEITIYCAHDVRHGVEASLEMAAELCASGKSKVLYLNTAFTNRKFLAAVRALPAQANSFEAYNIEMGTLSDELGWIRETIEREKIQYLVINAWEFGHNTYAQKDRTIYGLMKLLNNLGITVLVYSHVNHEKVQAGKIHRGTFGKLSALADQIIEVKKVEVEQASPLVSEPATKENKKLLPNKINDLDYARSDSEVSIGGELVLTEEEVVEEDLVLA